MTNYSKLSDAEIAERVCRRLGAPAFRRCGFDPCMCDWFIKVINMPAPVAMDYFSSADKGYEYLCFDWPAPIMMQKVKEWLKAEKIGWRIEYSFGDGFKCELFDKYGIRFLGVSQCLCEESALYEAFLQVGE